jgi:hypothetical protein
MAFPLLTQQAGIIATFAIFLQVKQKADRIVIETCTSNYSLYEGRLGRWRRESTRGFYQNTH